MKTVFRILLQFALLMTLCEAATAARTAPKSAEPQTSELSRPVVPADHVSWRRDPFIEKQKAFKRRVIKPEYMESYVNLQGIMQADSTYHVLINGETVKAGETVDGITIESVSRYQVVVRDQAGTRTYDIHQGTITRGKQ
ncbi:MAG: hypothetical protein WCP10_08185 [Desulfuromonadales bacterium]